VFQAGRLVAEDGELVVEAGGSFDPAARHTMRTAALTPECFALPLAGRRARIIELVPGQLLTEQAVEDAPQREGRLAADPARDLARLVVIERHTASGRVGQGLLRGLGLAHGALASSVAHDSHNLVVAAADDASLLTAARRVAEMGGGLCVARGEEVLAELPLPLAGLMSDHDLATVLAQSEELERAAAQVCRLDEPFMALAFVSLPVIPKLKLTDRGLVDVEAFRLVPLFVDQ
jgi:adenine deaminase